MLDVLLKIDYSLIEAYALTRAQTRFGSIVALVDNKYTEFWANYGIIISTDPVTTENLKEFRVHMEAQGRIPRFEYREEVAPYLAEMLEAEGYTLERDDPVMLLRPSDVLRPRKRVGLTHELLTQSNVREFISTVAAAFGGEDPISDDQCSECLRRESVGAQVSVLIRCDGVPAGGATLVLGSTVSELAGVGTAPGFRRRGVASLASQVLCEKFFAEGGELVWLSAGDPTAYATYANLGFTLAGHQLNYSIPAAS